MSRTEKLERKIRELQGELKEVKAKEKPFYIVTGEGVVVMKRAEQPAKSCVRWIGESGSKELKVEGDFIERLLQHNTVKGKGCIRITPLLKKLGYKFDGKAKTWNLPVQEVPAEEPEIETVADNNPLI